MNRQQAEKLKSSVVEIVRSSFEEGPMSLQEVLDVISCIFHDSPLCLTITVMTIASLIADGVIEDVETQLPINDPIENHRWRLAKRRWS
jgi:hypothetical protein